MRNDAPRLCRVAGRSAWHIYHARRRVSTGCENKAEAQAVLDEYLRGIARPTASAAETVASLLDRYFEDRRTHAVPGLDRIGWSHKQVRRLMGSHLARNVSEASCRLYQRHRLQDGVRPSTIRTELQALRAALRWALGDDAPKVVMPARAPARDRWLEREESARLLSACRHHHLRVFVALALHTAARSHHILGLTWDRVDLASRRIDFRLPGRVQAKKRAVRVPINDTLFGVLRDAHEARTCEFVVEWAGRSVKSVRHGVATAARVADVGHVSPHVFRHTAVTWMMRAGVPAHEIAGMAGMTIQMVEDVYGHHHPDYMQRAALALA